MIFQFPCTHTHIISLPLPVSPKTLEVMPTHKLNASKTTKRSTSTSGSQKKGHPNGLSKQAVDKIPEVIPQPSRRGQRVSRAAICVNWYTWRMFLNARWILYIFGISLVYIWSIFGIYLVYLWYIYLEYVWYKLGICLVYIWYMICICSIWFFYKCLVCVRILVVDHLLYIYIYHLISS